MYNKTDRDCVENNIKDIVDLVKVGLFYSTFRACSALSTSSAISNLPSPRIMHILPSAKVRYHFKEANLHNKRVRHL